MAALTFDKDKVKQKIDCCFAAAVYELYLNKRFGVNFCKKPTEDRLQKLNLLKNTFDYFYKTDYNCFCDPNEEDEDEDTFCCSSDDCNIEHIIEKINLI